MARTPESIPTDTYVLNRGFRLIGPFFAMLVPFAVWAFFIDDAEPENVSGGLLAVSILMFFAAFSHLSWLRTRVRVDTTGIAIRSIVRERRAAWRDIRFATIDGADLTLHLVNGGAPLKVSAHLANFGTLVQLIDELGLLRTSEHAV